MKAACILVTKEGGSVCAGLDRKAVGDFVDMSDSLYELGFRVSPK